MFAAEHSIERADRVEARLINRVASLRGLPRQGRPIGQAIRELSLPDVQLVVRYRIMDDQRGIRILRVWHTRENREQS